MSSDAAHRAAPPGGRLRVGFFVPDLALIGAQRMVATVLRRLDRARFAPTLFALDARGAVRDELPPDLPLVDLAALNPFGAVPRLRVLGGALAVRRALGRHRLDVAVGHAPIMNLHLLLWSSGPDAATRVIAEEHCHLTGALTLDPGEPSPAMRRAYPWLVRRYRRAAVLRCVSEAARRDFVERWGVPAEVARFLAPPVDLERLTAAAAAGPADHPWLREAVPLVMGVGRLATQKDFGLLLEAFARLRRRQPCRLVLVGEGPERPRLEAKVRALGLDGEVLLTGRVASVPAWLSRASAFALTSRWEGRPAVIVEAQHLGVPVASVACPSGPDELIAPERSGLLVPPGDAEALSAALARLLSEPGLAARLAAGGREAAQASSAARQVPAFEALLEEVAARPR